MQPWIIAANALGGGAVFAGIAVLVWLDQRGKTQRRRLEHVERLKAIEAGVSLPDAEVARCQALGAVGVAAVISSMSAAIIGTLCVVLTPGDWGREVALVIIWLTCCTVGALGAWYPAHRLGKQASPRTSEAPRPTSTAITDRLS